MLVHLDFETYSVLDVRHVGAYRYAEHPSTEVLIMCYAFDDEPVITWTPDIGLTRNEQRLFRTLAQGGDLGAHNAEFEYNAWNVVLLRQLAKLHGRSILRYARPLHATQLACTAARAAMCSLPRGLERVGAALSLPIQKDKEGTKLIKLFCTPRKPTKNNPATRVFPEDEPIRFRQFKGYCRTDVESERALHHRLPALSKFERKVYLLNRRVNDRGIPIDVEAIKKAQVVVTELERRARVRVNEITGGINPTQVEKVKNWIGEQGIDLDNLQALTIKNVLELNSDLTEEVKELLQLRMESSKVSTKKLVSMMRVVCRDARARGTLLYYGAHTGRESGRLIQPHNFIRGLPDKLQQIALMAHVFRMLDFADADCFGMFYDFPLTSIAQCMRGFIAATRGKRFGIVDYAQIEARLLVWLAGQEDVLEAFRQGRDVYKELAAFLWNIDVERVSSEQRRIAKNLVLGCGFQLGAPNFIKYCAKNGVIIELDMSKRAVGAYRERNPMVVQYWYDVERCAIAAVRSPGMKIYLRDVTFYCTRNKEFLIVVLPSRRGIYYPFPQVRMVEKFGKIKPELTFMDEFNGKWLRASTYGGKEVENIDQGIARDIMMCGGESLEDAGYPLVLDVHDELICEIDDDFGSVQEMERLACTLPDWIGDCPITAEGFMTKRYRKN